MSSAGKHPGGASDPSLDIEPPMSVAEMFRRLLKPLASLRLTVVLFAMSMVLVFCGTLAQRYGGIDDVVRTYFRSMRIVWIPLKIFFPKTDDPVGGGFPYPGGWLIGAVLLANLLAAHAVRFRINWRRLGILFIHSGLLLLLLGELITGMYQVEANMDIPEGSYANSVYLPKAVELAIIDPSDPKTDDVTVIPEGILRRGNRISNEDLPFDVVVEKYFVNSNLLRMSPGEHSMATAGVGLRYRVEELPAVTGTQDQRIDAAAAYVTFKRRHSDDSIGTYLMPLFFSMLHPQEFQTVTVDGKTYKLLLRLKRIYKPYTVHLEEFKNEYYLGTEIPKNFSSRVRLVDPTQDVDRELTIWMNHPLRHAGETFYQAGVLNDVKGTILQVVRNPGWEVPYVACSLVAFGLLYHFGLHLVRFVRRSQT